MENQSTPTDQPATPPPPESDSDSDIPNRVTTHHSDHISLSPEHSPASSSLISISHRSSPENEKPHSLEKPPETVYRNVSEQPTALVNRASLEEPVTVVTKTDPVRRRVSVSPSLSILRRGEREKTVKRAGLGFRVLGFLFCLVSFAVMAADRNQGWALDSFHRYIEFRYCMSVNVIGFLYSGAQALDLSYNFATGKYVLQHQQVRCYLDFTVDQIVAYLLISASSSAAIRIDDWQSNWGKDKFPDMATASVSMSFLAFLALASSSLISGYALCTSKSL